MLWVPLLLHHLLPHPATTLPAKQRNLSEKAHWPPNQISLLTGSSTTSRKVERCHTGGGNSGPFAIQVLSPQWHPSQRPSQLAGCSLQAAICPTRKEWLVECSTLPGCVKMKGFLPYDWIPGHLGCPKGEVRRNGGAGLGSSMVHHTIWNAPRDAVWSSSGAPQLPYPLLEKGNLMILTMLDVVEKGPVTPLIPTEIASSPEEKSEPREEEPTNLPAPNGQQASEPEGAASSGKLALVQRWLQLVPPGFTGSWADKSGQPP